MSEASAMGQGPPDVTDRPSPRTQLHGDQGEQEPD